MDASHQKTKFFRCGILTRDDVHDLTFVKDRNAIRERQDFIQIFGDEHDGRALPALLQQLFADVFRRADVEPTGGLRSNNDTRVAGDLACKNHFLNIPAREVLCQGFMRRRLDMEFLDQLIGMAGNIA